MDELVSHYMVRAYEHLEVASVLSETKYRRLKGKLQYCVCVCNIDDCGKLNLI